ncbi:Astra associated protein 1 Asa1 [Knufia obscura]|uniref:ASTRA-associated protein 1 n=1 Tax=Knufia obscura TaxID=1635080 RepID=A0ABR0REF0_9EURO|nr:Astra associated protein 1 Asa1 [Knufia obscura]
MPSQTASTPPILSYIFRGHTSSIHALHFFSSNHYFASGDSEGWIVIWRLTTRRPAAAWKAHDGGVMGIKDWNGNRLITHGRDHKLRIWQVREEALDGLSRVLPVDAKGDESRQPWLVHSMDVNALNFCAFAVCADSDRGTQTRVLAQDATDAEVVEVAEFKPLLLAAPNGLDQGGVDIFHLPSEQRVSKLQSDMRANTGMVMALRIFYGQPTGKLTLVVGYEDGSVAVYVRKEQNVMPVWIWEKVMAAKPHTQPVLSLGVLPSGESFITSSADATVAKFGIPSMKMEDQAQAEKTSNTKHAGQQDLKIRSDGRVFATAGWDKNVRVYSTKTLKELAVLQWHQEGCYAFAFAEVLPEAAANERALVAGNAMDKMKLERDAKVHNTHWLVAGSKDGKISLWDVY